MRGVKSTKMAKTSRLPTNVLTHHEKEQCIELVQSTLETLLNATKMLGKYGSTVKVTNQKKENGSYFNMDRIQMKGSVSEVMKYCMEGMHSDPVVYGKKFEYMASHLLDVIIPSTTSAPNTFLGLRWILHSPELPFSKSRDYCLLEFCQEFVDERGRKGWARCFHSFAHESCPDMADTHGYIRASTTNSGYVVKESDKKNEIDVFIILDIDVKGKGRALLSQLTFSKRMRAIRVMDSDLQRQRRHQLLQAMRNLTTAGASSLADIILEEDCASCGQPFKSTRDGASCKLCFKAICYYCRRENISVMEEQQDGMLQSFSHSESSNSEESNSNSSSSVLGVNVKKINKRNCICVACYDQLVHHSKYEDDNLVMNLAKNMTTNNSEKKNVIVSQKSPEKIVDLSYLNQLK